MKECLNCVMNIIDYPQGANLKGIPLNPIAFNASENSECVGRQMHINLAYTC